MINILKSMIVLFNKDSQKSNYTGIDDWLYQNGYNFQIKLIEHFKADSKPVNVSDEQSITDEELVSKIEDVIGELEVEVEYIDNNGHIGFISNSNTAIKKLLGLFKTYRIMPNPDQNNSDDK